MEGVEEREEIEEEEGMVAIVQIEVCLKMSTKSQV